MEDQEIIIPKIDNNFEKFDIESFQKHNLSRYDEVIGNNVLIVHTGDKADDQKKIGFSKVVYKTESYFNITKNFYSNGNIQIKGISFNNGSQYGIWYEFDENGNLIEEIDMDKGFDFGWEQVILYCIENKIELTKGYETSGFQTTIYKEENDEGDKIWVITYQIAGDQLLELTLDGKTGEEINRKELEFINH